MKAEKEGDVRLGLCGVAEQAPDDQQGHHQRFLHRIHYREERATQVVSFPEMDLRLTEEQQLLRVAVREFAEAEIRPHVMAWDEAQAFSLDLLPKLAAQGLMGIQVPEAFGGSDMSAVAFCVCDEDLA